MITPKMWRTFNRKLKEKYTSERLDIQIDEQFDMFRKSGRSEHTFIVDLGDEYYFITEFELDELAGKIIISSFAGFPGEQKHKLH